VKIEELQELSKRLDSLMKDPQPGLITWCMFLDDVMNKLVDGWTKKRNDE
jgi:hypothetical protein